MCVLHQGVADIEVLMVRRCETARFMAGAWVFPGGVVDPEDHSVAAIGCVDGTIEPELGPWLAAGLREVVEETGVWLTDPPFVAPPGDDLFAEARARGVRFAGDRIAYFANWITPTMVPVRFDTRFFIAAIAEKVVPEPDEREVDAAQYVTPREALRRAAAREWLVPFPTQRTLEQIADFESVDAALDEWRHREVVAVQPRMKVADDGSLDVVLPGESGFDELADATFDREALRRVAQTAAQRGQPIVEATGGRD
jgi:8-oxo-dGTP pyrophosphatase MutT (NUDIX family)